MMNDIESRARASQLDPGSPEAQLYLGRILFFLATSVIAYIYAWKKGVFKWD